MAISRNIRDRNFNRFKDINSRPHTLITTAIKEYTLLDEVTSTGASGVVNCSDYNKLTFHIIPKGITSGGNVKIQHSLDGTNYYDVVDISVTDNTITEVVVEDQKYKYVVANLTARTDGTYSVLMFEGN